MDIVTLLSPDRISCNQTSSSKKRTFEMLASLLATGQNQVDQDTIFDALISREKLGCTALGKGVAIPHARLDIAKPRAAILTLKEGIDLDAPDKQPVKVLISIIVPEETSDEECQVLKELAGLLPQKRFVENLYRYQEPSIIIDYFNSYFGRDLIAA